MVDPCEAVNVVRGMALSAATAIAGNEAVRTQVTGEHDSPRPVGVRVFIGERSAVVSLDGIALDAMLKDRPTWAAVETRIQSALAELH